MDCLFDIASIPILLSMRIDNGKTITCLDDIKPIFFDKFCFDYGHIFLKALGPEIRTSGW